MDEHKTVNVVVTDIQMPFISMVIFMVKWTITAIPAFFILGMFVSIFFGLMNGMMMH